MINDKERRLFAVASLALRYPTPDWMESLVAADLRELSPLAAEATEQLLHFFAETPLLDLQMKYVDLFDRKRRAGLHLSYYLNGDTRARGVALLRFKHIYNAEGWEPDCQELPDYLPMLLEFIAVTKSPVAFELLSEHRAGVALLHIALRDMKSEYAPLMNAILEAIPGDSMGQALKLIAKGPQVELVGLAPYGGGTR